MKLQSAFGLYLCMGIHLCSQAGFAQSNDQDAKSGKSSAATARVYESLAGVITEAGAVLGAETSAFSLNANGRAKLSESAKMAADQIDDHFRIEKRKIEQARANHATWSEELRNLRRNPYEQTDELIRARRNFERVLKEAEALQVSELRIPIIGNELGLEKPVFRGTKVINGKALEELRKHNLAEIRAAADELKRVREGIQATEAKVIHKSNLASKADLETERWEKALVDAIERSSPEVRAVAKAQSSAAILDHATLELLPAEIRSLRASGQKALQSAATRSSFAKAMALFAALDLGVFMASATATDDKSSQSLTTIAARSVYQAVSGKPIGDPAREAFGHEATQPEVSASQLK